MFDMDEIIRAMPKMLSGDELKDALGIFPKYDSTIRNEQDAVRYMSLSHLYNIYVPSQMSSEIYSKLYLALLRSLQKKSSKMAVVQQHENSKAIASAEYTGIIGGSDSFTIIGTSGIGKSTAISRAISLITKNRIIEIEKPYQKIIPCVVVQCPYDSSVKGMLLEILRKVDEVLESKYYANALRARATTDMLIGSVSQVALNHIGLLIVDEIQNVVNSKNGKSLIGSLTQLINNSGISICMVGTPESIVFFEQAMQLARRSLGLQYQCMGYNEDFRHFCEVVFAYQYVKKETHLTDVITEWLYEHSAGITAVVISLLHDAQEIAISNGMETLDLTTLYLAYEKRMSLLHTYIQPSIIHNKQSGTVRKSRVKSVPIKEIPIDIEHAGANVETTIADMVEEAKAKQMDVVEVLKNMIHITEVKL